MNSAQQLFAIFFAIFWGASANAHPRWKPFNLPLFCECKPTRNRVFLSVCLLNLSPLAYFGVAYWKLGDPCESYSATHESSVFFLIVRSVVPAYAAFGFYRVWIGFIEWRPKWFYFEGQSDLPDRYRPSLRRPTGEPWPDLTCEPTIDRLAIPESDVRNIWYGTMYVVVSLGVLFLWPRK